MNNEDKALDPVFSTLTPSKCRRTNAALTMNRRNLNDQEEIQSKTRGAIAMRHSC